MSCGGDNNKRLAEWMALVDQPRANGNAQSEASKFNIRACLVAYQEKDSE